MKRIKIEHRAYKHNQWKNHDNAADDFIYYYDAAVVEFPPYLVYQPRQPEPPQQRSADNAEIAHTHVQRMLWNDKGKLGKRCHEKEYYQRIGERNKECRHPVVYQRTFLFSAYVYLLGRVWTVTIYPESHQHYASRYLQDKTVLVVVYQIHDETHAETRYQRINEVADRRTNPRNKAIPAAFVQCALYAKHTNRSHRRWRHNANEHPFKNPVEYV